MIDYHVKSGTLSLNLGSNTIASNGQFASKTLIFGSNYLDLCFGVCQGKSGSSDGNYSFQILNSDDPDFNTFTVIDPSRLDTGTYSTLDITAEAYSGFGNFYRKVQLIDVIGLQPYFYIVCTSSNVTTGATIEYFAEFGVNLKPDQLNENPGQETQLNGV